MPDHMAMLRWRDEEGRLVGIAVPKDSTYIYALMYMRDGFPVPLEQQKE